VINGDAWLYPQLTRSVGPTDNGQTDLRHYTDECGLDIRSWVATHLLAGLLACPDASGDLIAGAVLDADKLIEELNIRYEKDGNMWCATRPDFINLQESAAGFGATKLEANKDLKRNEQIGRRG